MEKSFKKLHKKLNLSTSGASSKTNSLLQNRPTAKAMGNTGVDSLSEHSSGLMDVSSLEQDGLRESEALNTSTTRIGRSIM
uniref:Uncharacterized protein n=1 Tax=Ciona intestinalis TaxID=7719 RepID=H2XQX4_CIOIN